MAPKSDEKCAECPDPWADGRWICSQAADWQDAGGKSPWGDPESATERLRYLAGMDETEHRELAEIAFEDIDTGYWQGCASKNGGWEDGAPWGEDERQWRLTARDFYERYRRGEWELTEGMMRYANWDLCRELAWLRGWCPQITAWRSDGASVSWRS